MARKVQEYQVSLADTDNRDRGKTYVITEMPATQAEAWAIRALLALARNGTEVPAEALQAGFAGLIPYLTNLVGAVRWEDAQPLLAEMLTCVQYQATIDAQGTKFTRKLVDGDIEETETLMLLRKEVIKLHKGFLRAVGNLISPAATKETPGLAG